MAYNDIKWWRNMNDILFTVQQKQYFSPSRKRYLTVYCLRLWNLLRTKIQKEIKMKFLVSRSLGGSDFFSADDVIR